MANEGMFRYLSVRPATMSEDVIGLHAGVDHSGSSADGTGPSVSLFQQLADAKAKDATPDQLRKIVEKFMKESRYVRAISDLPLDIGPLLAWFLSVTRSPLNKVDFAGDVKKTTGDTLKALIAKGEYASSYAALLESAAADALLPKNVEHRRDDLIAAISLLHFLRRVDADPNITKSTEPLGSFVSRQIVILPRVASIRPKLRTPPDIKPTPPKQVPDQNELRERLKRLIATRQQLALLATSKDAMVAEEPGKDTKPPALDKNRRLSVTQVQALRETLTVEGEGREEALKRLAFERLLDLDDNGTVSLRLPEADVRLKSDVAERLPTEAKTILMTLGFSLDRLNPLQALASIEHEIVDIGGEISSSLSNRTLLRVGSLMLDVEKIKAGLGYGAAPGELPAPGFEAHQCSFMAGIGDLLLVRQKLKAYELAEFAHVENVLAGETRERTHRRLNVREDITEVEQEEETEKERDLQSTERHELQAEAERTVKNEFNLEAGLQVSGSYGPSVSFSSSLNASFSTVSEESQRKSMSYSREVTERTTERIRERVRELRRRRLLEEVEETNLHRVDASGAFTLKHTRGIYRWLNKISDAQVYQYGQRMMFEFVVPEPAAFLLYALVDNPPADPELIKPDPPTYFGSPLRPSNLTLGNYNDYIAKYQVLNAPAPPPAFIVASMFEKQDGNQENNYGRASKVAITEGYEAFGAVVSSDFIFTQGKATSFRIMVGNQSLDRSGVWGSAFHYFSRKFRNEVSVSAELMSVRSFVLGVDVFCELTPERFRKWKQEMFDAIMQAYQQQLADYQDKLAATAIAQGIQIYGRNPLENRRIERDELKKITVVLLTQQPYLDMNGFEPGPEPILKLKKVCEDGPFVRFFENAFEWHNILYVCYPYFWGRHARWISAIHLTDPDPDFAAFLKAGAARVQVPIRPGFERAMAHFCQFGEIWEGNDPPLIDDDLYVPIVDEIAANLGRLDAGVPYPADSQPWDVVVPTDLVVLQDIDEVSAIRDVMTGQPIDLD